jgi:hypothetical protein
MKLYSCAYNSPLHILIIPSKTLVGRIDIKCNMIGKRLVEIPNESDIRNAYEKNINQNGKLN